MDLNTLRAKVNNHHPELILPERPIFTAVMIPLVESIIAGQTQQDKVNTIDKIWYVL